LRILGKFPESRGFLEEAIVQQRIALQPDPRYPRYREQLRSHAFSLSMLLLELGDHRAAAKAAAELAAVGDNPLDFHFAASRLLNCASVAEVDSKLTKADRDKLKEAYSSRAVEILREGTNKGMKLEHLKRSREYEPLR